MDLLNIILMASPQATDGATKQSPLGMFLPLILILVIFWIFMIRPQAKRQKELTKFRSSIQKGDKIVTTGGIYGKVVSTTDTVVVIQVDENTKLTVDKASVLRDPSDIQQAQK